jgi:hypothetical protein
MTIRRSVQSAAGWTFRWGLEVMIAVVIAGLVAAMMFGGGCTASTRVTPASTHIEQEVESAPRTTTTKRITGFTPDGSPITEETTVSEPGVTRQRLYGEATGAGASATGDKLDQQIDSGAPTLNLPGVGRGSGGSVSGDVSASIAGVSVFVILGGVCVLGGIACFAMQLYPRAGVGLLAIGGCLIAVGLFPWLWWLLLAVGVVAVALYVWAERNGKSMHEAVRAVAAGVEDLSDDVKSKVKDRIRFHADARDKAVIKNVKKADELGGAS